MLKILGGLNMSDKEYKINIEGQDLTINLINRTRRAIKDMGLNEYPIYGTLLAMGTDLLHMKDNTNFIIIDELQNLGIVGIKDGKTIAVDIIAVVQKENIFIKRGTKVLKYGMDS